MNLRHRRQTEAEVIDISPLTCPQCNQILDEVDFFCRTCGTDLTAPPGQLEQISPTEDSSRSHTRRTSFLVGGTVLAVLLVSGGLYWWLTRGPNLAPYDDALHGTLMIASASQDDVDALGDPSGLDRLESAISLELEELRIMANDAQAIEDDEHRAAILSFIDAEKRYLTELVRLAGLSSEEASIDQYDLIGDLADEAEEEMAAAITLRPGDPPVTGVVLSPAPLTRALSELAAYRAEVVKERARITRLNKERAKKLATVRSATEQVDGIIDRYSTARAELSNWISGVNSHGATFLEAYQVLDQQAERRRQLRDELAALEMPDPFGQDKAALLAVMDQAVAATEAAYRGIEEYQYDFNYRYYSYDQTPGWLQFEAATDDISDSYSATLANYEDRKLTVLKKISRRTPLPKLPD